MQLPSLGLMELFGDISPKPFHKQSFRIHAESFPWLMTCRQGPVSSKLLVAPMAEPGTLLSILGGQGPKAPGTCRPQRSPSATPGVS